MAMTDAAAGYKPKIWSDGNWNAFFGFGTNILVNMLVLTGLLRFVLKMPDSLVFGRILPALGQSGFGDGRFTGPCPGGSCARSCGWRARTTCCCRRFPARVRPSR